MKVGVVLFIVFFRDLFVGFVFFIFVGVDCVGLKVLVFREGMFLLECLIRVYYILYCYCYLVFFGFLY